MPARAFWRAAAVVVMTLALSGVAGAARADPLTLPIPVPSGQPWCC